MLEKSAPSGLTDEEKVLRSLQLDPKEKRKYHDDVTIEVVSIFLVDVRITHKIFFDENRFDEVACYQLKPEYFRPNLKNSSITPVYY